MEMESLSEEDIVQAILDSGGYDAFEQVMWEKSLMEPVQTISLACDHGFDVGEFDDVGANEFKEYKEKGTSFILTSHDMSEIERIADIVGVLMDGKIIFEGSPKKLTGNSNNLYKISYLLKRTNDLEENNISDQTNINYKEIVTSNITLALEELITHNRSSNLEFSDLRIERPTLEEAFIKILENEKKENK